jgi:hypothetical protein
VSRRPYRYAFLSLLAIGCDRGEDLPAVDSGTIAIAPAQARPATVSGDSAAPARQGNPSLDPTDTVPVRRAPPTTQSIVDTASLPTIQQIVSHHPQRVDSTITAMTEELKRLNRQPSAQFTALQDSCKQDLVRLAGIGNDELVAFFRTHYARFERLIAAHRSRVGG